MISLPRRSSLLARRARARACAGRGTTTTKSCGLWKFLAHTQPMRNRERERERSRRRRCIHDPPPSRSDIDDDGALFGSKVEKAKLARPCAFLRSLAFQAASLHSSFSPASACLSTDGTEPFIVSRARSQTKLTVDSHQPVAHPDPSSFAHFFLLLIFSSLARNQHVRSPIDRPTRIFPGPVDFSASDPSLSLPLSLSYHLIGRSMCTCKI